MFYICSKRPRDLGQPADLKPSSWAPNRPSETVFGGTVFAVRANRPSVARIQRNDCASADTGVHGPVDAAQASGRASRRRNRAAACTKRRRLHVTSASARPFTAASAYFVSPLKLPDSIKAAVARLAGNTRYAEPVGLQPRSRRRSARSRPRQTSFKLWKCLARRPEGVPRRCP